MVWAILGYVTSNIKGDDKQDRVEDEDNEREKEMTPRVSGLTCDHRFLWRILVLSFR